MNNGHLIVMTEVSTKPERQVAVWKAMAEIAQIAREQTGCIEYQILQDVRDQATTINYEHWASETERNAFMDSPAVAVFVEAIDIDNSFVGNPGPVSYKVMA